MNILGISCFYHDAAACLLRDGAIVAAAQEERFTRKKHSADFPLNAINHCVQAGDTTFADIDYFAFYEKPYLKFYRVIMDHLRSYPYSYRNFLRAMPEWLQDRLILPILLQRELGYEGETLFVKHHMAHAASAFLVSPFEQAAILTADGVGEWGTLSIGQGHGTAIAIEKEIHYPDSLGLLYTTFTTYLGFRANGGEGKTMGLAAYGAPTYLEQMRALVDVKPDGSFALDHHYFGFNEGRRMYSGAFERLFGPPREPESEFEQRHYDIAASLQVFTEDVLIKIATHLHAKTGQTKMCVAGGVGLNCVANHRMLRETPFEELFVQPAAGDAGGALGAALAVYHGTLGRPRTQVMTHPYLGARFTETQMRRALLNARLAYEECESDEELCGKVAQMIADGKVIGWYQGATEFGPRALGNRSILGDPRSPEMKDILNRRVKKREGFRPFAPAVLEEKAAEYFELDCPSPFMLLAPFVRAEKREVIPAVTHVDGTARVQTVNRDTNPLFYDLIAAFERVSGVPMIVNTSFNLRGEPIVCSPEDAIGCFEHSGMDVLVLGRYVVTRNGEER